MLTNKEKVWAVLQAPPGLTLIDRTVGNVIAIDGFIGNVLAGGFIDRDGFGEWATKTHSDPNTWVYPSQIKNGKAVPPAWATHVVWYNQ